MYYFQVPLPNGGSPGSTVPARFRLDPGWRSRTWHRTARVQFTSHLNGHYHSDCCNYAVITFWDPVTNIHFGLEYLHSCNSGTHTAAIHRGDYTCSYVPGSPALFSAPP